MLNNTLYTPILQSLLEDYPFRRRGVAIPLSSRFQIILLFSKGYSRRSISRQTSSVSSCLSRSDYCIDISFSNLSRYLKRRYRDSPVHPLIHRAQRSSSTWCNRLDCLQQLLSPQCVRCIMQRALSDRRCKVRHNKHHFSKQERKAVSLVAQTEQRIAFELIEQAQPTKKRRFRKCSGIEHKRYIINEIKKHPYLYLDELCVKVQQHFHIDMSISTMWHRLKEWGFTKKKSIALSISSLSEKNKIRRRAFVNQYFTNADLSKVGSTCELQDQVNWEMKRYIYFPEYQVTTTRSQQCSKYHNEQF